MCCYYRIFGEFFRAALSKKINRILSAIDNKKDRRWLECRLKHAAEPSLSERLAAVLEKTPFTTEPSKLKKFSDEVAKFRNDLAHFGGSRDNQDYRIFKTRLQEIYLALSYMYHFALLKRIGVSQDQLRWWATQGFESLQIQQCFIQSGLRESEPTWLLDGL